MKRSGIIAFMIVALVLAASASLSAAPMNQSAIQGADPQKWIGKTATDLLIQKGVPTMSNPDGNGGTTLKYINRENIGRGNPIEFVQQFDVDRAGRVTSEQVYQM